MGHPTRHSDISSEAIPVQTSIPNVPYWQPKLGCPGEVVTGLDDLAQCLMIIVQTRKGSVPHRPEFGCDAWRFLDNPVLDAAPNVILAVSEAISLWEPRVKLVKVTYEPSIGSARVVLHWIAVGEDMKPSILAVTL